MGIQVGDNSLIYVVSLKKRMRSSSNPDFRYSGADFDRSQTKRVIDPFASTVTVFFSY